MATPFLLIVFDLDALTMKFIFLGTDSYLRKAFWQTDGRTDRPTDSKMKFPIHIMLAWKL